MHEDKLKPKPILTKEEIDSCRNPRTGRIAVNKIAWLMAKKERLMKEKAKK